MTRVSLKKILFALIAMAMFAMAIVFVVLKHPARTAAGVMATPSGADVSSVTQAKFRLDFAAKQAFDDAYADASAVKATAPIDDVTALLVPHHFLAKEVIAKVFLSGAGARPERIILISPDHYHQSFPAGKSAFVTDGLWQTPYGSVSADAGFIRAVSGPDSAILRVDLPFYGEHGIFTEVPFIRKTFPDAEIVPLIVKNTYDFPSFEAIGKFLAGHRDAKRTLVIVSSDFTHDATHTAAMMNDASSIRELANIGTLSVRYGNITNDCRSCLAVLSGLLMSPGQAPRFRLIENSDGSAFGAKDDGTLTSYVGGVFTAAATTGKSVSPVTLLFGGDMMFDQWIRTVVRTKVASYPLAPLRETFLEADAVIANLEGPITTNDSVSETSEIGSRDNYVFTFDPSIAPMLRDDNIIANIGNNHILNFKEAGVTETEKYLHDAGVGFFGSPLATESRIFVKDFHGFRVAFVNYNQFIYGGESKALEDIRAAKGQADFIVLYAHWGKEYIPATDREKQLAHEFIDAGADLVIGSHPHVVQEHEVYKGKTVYYSLGNLVFDQYDRDETRTGLLVSVTIDPKTRGYEISEKPVIMGTNGQTRIR